MKQFALKFVATAVQITTSLTVITAALLIATAVAFGAQDTWHLALRTAYGVQASGIQDAFEFVAPGVLADESAVESQSAPSPEPELSVPVPVGGLLGQILTWLFSATGLMLIGQLLRRTGIPQRIPGWARPLIGPLLGVAAAALSGVLGFVPDLSILEGVLLGATAAVMFDSAKEAGLVTSTKG